MAGRKVLNEQDARRCLNAVNASRRELGAWAREHGVDGRSLNLWRVNLERRGVPRDRAAAPKLVELVVAPPAVTVAQRPFVLRIEQLVDLAQRSPVFALALERFDASPP